MLNTALVAVLFSVASPARAAAVPSSEELRALGEDAFVYGLPLVMAYTASYEFWVDRESKQYKGPFNELVHSRRVFTYEDTAVIVPNSDTPYSFACVDLRAEPYVITAPVVEAGRYFSIQFVDWNTFNFGYIGSRTTGNGGGDYLLAGPDWNGETPPGIKGVFRSSTQFAILIIRTQLFGPDDMPNVAKVQDGYRLRTLSAYQGKPAPPALPAIQFPKTSDALAKTEFLPLLGFVLGLAPAGPEEQGIRARLAAIGVGGGDPAVLAGLSADQKTALAEGAKAGEAKLKARLAEVGVKVNGWNIAAVFGNRDFYQGDWMLRAAGAAAGIFGNNADEAVYPMTTTLPDGAPIHTGSHRYTLTFPADGMPPVKAFWSVTMYSGETKLLIKNPIGRYLINAPMLPALKKNADGSITLRIQKDSPGPDLESNWLPAPDGPVYMVMRLYWPRTEAPSILPLGKGAWSPPPVVKVD